MLVQNLGFNRQLRNAILTLIDKRTFLIVLEELYRYSRQLSAVTVSFFNVFLIGICYVLSSGALCKTAAIITRKCMTNILDIHNGNLEKRIYSLFRLKYYIKNKY